MATTSSLFLVILVITPTLQDTANNQIDDTFQEVKSEILQEQTLQNVGGLLNSFMHSEGAKQLGDILSNAATGENAGEILQGLGSVLGQGKGLDPSMLGMLANMVQPHTGNKDDSIDTSLIFSLLGNFVGQSGDTVNLWNYVPMILQTANAFLGPEAAERAKRHSDHADFLPPIIEKLHLLFDHFINSELGKTLFNTLGAEKFIKVFADEEGRMSYRRFVDMLENHSFRKHWISMVTSKIAKVISHFSDPRTRKKYVTTTQHFINSILKSQKYPKSTLFDPNRPTETITNLVDHFAKESLNIKISSLEYVKPIVEYVKVILSTMKSTQVLMLLNLQELFRMVEKRGMLSVDSQKLSNKLADTINLEVIEPLVRVNRAFRFARKVPACDR